jgi:hypothetical protein
MLSYALTLAMQSQEQISAARKEIESQGGIVSLAKKEALRFESQLGEAQKAARERAQAGTTDEGDEVANVDGDVTKGKQRASIEGDDGVAVEVLEEKAAAKKTRSNSKSEPLVTSTGEAIFDVDGDMTQEEKATVDNTIQAAKQNAQTALHNVQSFWDKVQADPRLNNIQTSLAKTLKNVSVPVSTTKEGADGTSKTLPASFADVSKQFQASFPHLNWKESQTLAKKYLDASENVARDWGKEMTSLMSDLVKIVPPEEQENAKPALQKEATSAIKAEPVTLPTRTTEEEDFDWDGDMDSQSASAGLETTSAPETTSWDSGISDVAPKTDASPSTIQIKKATESTKDEDEESDWE